MTDQAVFAEINHKSRKQAIDESLKHVLECIALLTAEKGAAESSDIRTRTGLPSMLLKERLDTLLELGQVERVQRGFYRSVTVFAPPRPVSKTVLPDGMVVLEVGDTVLHLSPAEDRMLRCLCGSVFELVSGR